MVLFRTLFVKKIELNFMRPKCPWGYTGVSQRYPFKEKRGNHTIPNANGSFRLMVFVKSPTPLTVPKKIIET